VEAEGWVTYHKNLGIYEVTNNPVDLKIPYYPQQPWINVARSFDIALEKLNLRGDETILDLGAGRGWAAKQFAMRGCRVVALDIVPDENVGLGRSRALMDNVGVYFDRIIADGENLPFFRESFDLVFCAATLHHASNLSLLMQNISQVLKINGRLCAINEPCLSVLDDEIKTLARDASPELAVGINETRPDMIRYEHTLRQAGLMITSAFPAATYHTNHTALRHWAEETGTIWPPFTPLAIRPMLRRFARYLTLRLLAIKNGSFFQAAKLLSRYGPDNLLMAALVWTGGELFLIARKSPKRHPR
jgi:SAM-dependent methyltransferase